MNLIPIAVTRRDGAAVLTLAGEHQVPLDADFLPGVGDGKLTLGIRPENISLEAGDIALAGTLRLVERLGSETMLHVTLADGESVVLKAVGTVQGRTGDAVTIYLSLNQSHIFDAHGLALRHPERPS